MFWRVFGPSARTRWTVWWEGLRPQRRKQMVAISCERKAGCSACRSTINWRMSGGRLRDVSSDLPAGSFGKRLAIPCSSNCSAFRYKVRSCRASFHCRFATVSLNKTTGRSNSYGFCLARGYIAECAANHRFALNEDVCFGAWCSPRWQFSSILHHIILS